MYCVVVLCVGLCVCVLMWGMVCAVHCLVLFMLYVVEFARGVLLPSVLYHLVYNISECYGNTSVVYVWYCMALYSVAWYTVVCYVVVWHVVYVWFMV